MKFNPDGSEKMLRFLGYMLQKEPKGGLGEVMIPELMRNLTNLHACTSKSGRASEDVGSSMLPGFVARAANFAEFLPCVSQKLLHMVMAKLERQIRKSKGTQRARKRAAGDERRSQPPLEVGAERKR